MEKREVNNIISRIKKRDGKIVLFDQDRITTAIFKAAKSVGGSDKEESRRLSSQVVGILEDKFGVDIVPTVEQIQDLVEKILIENGHVKTAKAYILYREQRKKVRDIKVLLNSIEIIDNYVNQLDWRVKENSNMGYSLQGLNNHISTTIVSKYWLSKIYPEYIKQVHENGRVHIHDLGTLGAYCVGWDLRDLLLKGFSGVSGKTESKAPRHFRTALGQIVNFFYTLQGETAGAQAFSNFDTLLAPFIHYDRLNRKGIKQAMQEFIFNMNVPTRVGFQTPFTNLTMDLKVPEFMKNEHVIVGGKVMAKRYSEFQEEMDWINEIFAEVMMEGDAKNRVFTFPIPTYNITKEFDWDNKAYDRIWEMTAKFGIPYFSNFIHSDMKPDDARSMCCRLRLDNRELKKRGGGLFGANPLTGSIGVVTINLPQLAYLSKNETEFFEKLKEVMSIAKDSLEIKRKILEKFTEIGLYPYSKFYLKSVKETYKQYWKNHFSTIGLNGMNEALLNLWNTNIASEEGRKFTVKVLDVMRDKISQFQEETGNLYNLEATPAEGTGFRLAKIDKKLYPKIIVANEAAWKERKAPPYYTNCVSEDTECLTINGWKRYEELKINELILTLNTNTKKLEYQKILYLNTQRVENVDIYNIKTKKQNQILTPNHKILYDGNRKGKYQFATPLNVPHRLIIPQAAIYEPLEKIRVSDDFVRLIGWIITEGHFEKGNKGIRITQAEWANKKKFDEINALLKRIKYQFKIFGDKRGRSIFRIAAEDGRKIRKFIKKKNIPRLFLKRLPQKQLNILLETMMKGDGSISKHSSYFSTGDKNLADEFQELCIKTKKRGIISNYKDKCGSYHIVPARIHHTEITKKAIKKIKYTGIVWCPTVENGTWIARREGKPFITGNSTQLPVGQTDDIFEALKLQDEIQSKYTGGVVLHGFMGEKLSSVETTKILVKRIAENFSLPYYTLTPTFSVCPTHGYLKGEHKYCPKCDNEIGYQNGGDKQCPKKEQNVKSTAELSDIYDQSNNGTTEKEKNSVIE